MLIRVRSSISMPKTIIVPSRRWYSVLNEGLKIKLEGEELLQPEHLKPYFSHYIDTNFRY